MYRERAETFLRLLAEAELRRATAQPGDRAVVAGGLSRVMRVAGALTAVQVVGDEVTGAVLDGFELALCMRQIRSPAGCGRGLRSWLGSAPPRGTPAGPDVAVPIGQAIFMCPARDAGTAPGGAELCPICAQFRILNPNSRTISC
jgi:hypothetical protein